LNCSTCGGATRVLETRAVDAAQTRRRLLCIEPECGERFNTREFLDTVYVPPADLVKAARGVERRRQSFELRQAVIAREGVKATAVAHELGITEARVRQIRKELCKPSAASGPAPSPSVASRKPSSWAPC